MKTLIAVMALAFSLAAVAGPEEHIQAQTCYYVVTAESSEMNADVPSQICLESLNVDTSAETISVYSYFDAYLYKNLKLNSVTRRNEDFFNFKASSVVRDTEEGSVTQKLTLFISGKVDNYGEATELNYLTISVEQVIGRTWVEFPVIKNTYKYRAY